MKKNIIGIFMMTFGTLKVVDFFYRISIKNESLDFSLITTLLMAIAFFFIGLNYYKLSERDKEP
jgi:hypothetical protein